MIATIVIAALIFGAVGYIIGKGIYDRVRHKGGGWQLRRQLFRLPRRGALPPSAKPKT